MDDKLHAESISPRNRSDQENVYTFKPKNSSESAYLEAELRLTLEEIARLQNALADANMKIITLENSREIDPNALEDKVVMRPVLQELKQPLRTIQGYLDLLENESVGMLGTFQKRFIERIANSVEHMEKLLTGLVGDQESGDLEPGFYTQDFALISVVESNLALFTETFRLKSILLKVEFEKEDIQFKGDLEIFERILNILYSNACVGVAENGVISLTVKLLQGKKPQQVLISIQAFNDEEGKTKPLPVNLEEFKDLEIKLEGFGSQLKDLVKAKLFVEEMHGKMEIFSIPSKGSLVRIRLPLTP
jgi:signal transduction histidine kinase